MTNEELMIMDFANAAEMTSERMANAQKEAILEQIGEIKDALRGFGGLVLEVCGTWLWASGNTKEHKEVLKSLGFHYASKKQMWYWKSPTEQRKRGRTIPMQAIRDTYGSVRTETHDDDLATQLPF